MKKVFALLITICMVFSFVACTGTPTNDGDTTGENTESEINEFEGEDYIIEWVDSGFSNQISNLIGIPAGQIKASDVYDITTLQLSEAEKFEDLKHFYNLQALSLFRRADSLDFTPLANLKALNSLEIVCNDIQDISFLGELTSLTELLLAVDVEITDLSILSTLVSLEKVALYVNNLTDISALTELPNLTDLTIDFYGNDISQISELNNLTSLALSYVSADQNNTPDISFLRNFDKLTSLQLNGVSVDKSVIGDLTNLTELQLSFWDEEEVDISFLENLSNLTTLNMGANGYLDLTVLSGLSKLTTLYLPDASVTDISFINGLNELIELNLINNQIEDITPLSDLTKLEYADLSNNLINDITPLSNLSSLNNLTLRNNKISNISALSNLTKLRLIDFGYNYVNDISPLTNLPELVTVVLSENDISDWTAVDHVDNVVIEPNADDYISSGVDSGTETPSNDRYKGESYIGTWKASDSEHYITLNADGSCEAIYPGYEPQIGTFIEVAPTMLTVSYDDGENVILLYDGNAKTITNSDRNIIYNPFESEIPEGLTPEERLAEFKETVIGTWTSDTTDYVITINEDDTFTFENTIEGDFDSGTYIIETESGVGYQVDFDGEKYSYLPLQFENDTFGVHVVDDRNLGNSIVILVSENVFTLED